MMTSTSDSYPFLHLAQRLNVPYRDVLAVVEEFGKYPNRLAYWASLGPITSARRVSDAALRSEVALAVRAEQKRRGSVG